MTHSLDEAVSALAKALDRLEAAAARRARIDAGHADRDEELRLLDDDRARLAAECESAVGEIAALKSDRTAALAKIEAARRGLRATLGGE
ncbi:MAG: DUF4164 family protein [Hyphomicrobiales bacterium]|nr:DUF4164 family protein [Hyphomicrobiales bacterium]MDE2017680.1 DUF4164 family protein [Hyphomicrobiales bacterium]